MGAQKLSSRAIIGRLIRRLEEVTVASWVGEISWLNDQANMESEEYRWLDESPIMREWNGPRQAKGLADQGVIIPSKEYEATLEVKRRELFLDKTGQIRIRIDELASGTARHWAQLLTPLIANGATSVTTYGAAATYDGADFFGAGHRGSQDNALSLAAGTGTTPTTGEAVDMLLQVLTTFLSFTDAQGEPMNEGLRSLLVMVPSKYLGPFTGAITSLMVATGTGGGAIDNVLRQVRGLTWTVEANTRLDASFGAANKFAVFRTDNVVKALIRQEEEGLVVDALAEGSEEEIHNNRHIYGVRATRGVGYGRWEHAIEVTIT